MFYEKVIDIREIDGKIYFRFDEEGEKEKIGDLATEYLMDEESESGKLLKKINKRKVSKTLKNILRHYSADEIISGFSEKNRFKSVEIFVNDLREFFKEKVMKARRLISSTIDDIENFSDLIELKEEERKRLVALRFLEMFRISFSGDDRINEILRIINKYPNITQYEFEKGITLGKIIDKEIKKFSMIDFEKGRGYYFEENVDYIRKFCAIKEILTKEQLKRIQNTILSIGEENLRDIIKRRVSKENHRQYIKNLISLLPEKLKNELAVYII